MVIYFDLPLPPSSNNAFINVPGRGRVKSKGYEAWLKEVHALFKELQVPRWEGEKNARWHYTLVMTVPDWRRRDLDNVIKVTQDFLAKYLGLEDNYAMHFTARKQVMGGVRACVTGEVTIGG